MKAGKAALILTIVALVAAYFAFDLGQYFHLAYLKSQQAGLDRYNRTHPLGTALAFFLVYIAATGASLPVAGILTLAAGAIFGLGLGTLIASFASSIGATLAFLAARFVLRDFVKARFGARLDAVDAGVAREGGFYLFTLRMVPAFPFVFVNLALGLTSMKTWTYYWVSQIGMLAGTIVYVNAGTQLARIDALGSILSAGVVASFVLLGIFPLCARKAVSLLKARRRRCSPGPSARA